jgi:hypothetical protein
MKPNYLIHCITLAVAAGSLSACGGGGSGDSTTSSGATISSVGTITGFGSVYVNGIEFETDGASYRVDDSDGFDDSSLAVGMKVKVVGSINADGLTGTATSVFYDDDVEGPIDAGSLNLIDTGTKTFSIFGLEVRVSATQTVFDDGASFDGLAEGQKVEVSGYFDGNEIIATRIERQSDLDDEFELKGTVIGYDGSTVTLSLQNGAVAGPYSVSPAAELDIPADPTGSFVEVKLVDQSGGLVAIRIETDDDNLLDDSDNDVSVRGVLADDGRGGLLVNGVAFEVNSGTEYEPASLEGNLVAGMEVKVEGQMQGDILIADEVETEDGDIEIEARVIELSASDAKNGSVTLDLGNSQVLVVHTDNSTLFQDSSASDLNDDDSFNLGELAAGSDFVEIEAYEGDGGQLIATAIEREDGGRNTRLQAPLDSFDPNASVTLVGITYTVTGGTSYEVSDSPSDASTFFSSLTNSSVVKVKDIEPNGIAEELDLED